MFLLTIWTVNNSFVAERPDFKFDENFDAIAAAAAVGRLDLVAMVLTFVGIVAAFAIIYGWTAFRSVAIEAAKTEAVNLLPVELRRLMEAEGDRLNWWRVGRRGTAGKASAGINSHRLR